jgi:hypothetical protein
MRNPKAFLKKLQPLEYISSCRHITNNRCSESILLVRWGDMRQHTGPHKLVAAITLICFEHVSSSTEDLSFIARLCMRFQHNCAPPQFSFEVCQWLFENYLDTGWVADMKLKFAGLHAHLTWIFSISSVGTLENEDLFQYSRY